MDPKEAADKEKSGQRYQFGPFEFHSGDGVLQRDGHRVPLAPKAADVLLLLIRRQGQIVTRKDLSREIWGGVSVVNSTVDFQLHQLRRALGADLGRAYILTIPRRGFKFTAPVSVVTSDGPLTLLETPVDTAPPVSHARGVRVVGYVAIAVVICALAISSVAWNVDRPALPRVVGHTALTIDGGSKGLQEALIADDRRVYFRRPPGFDFFSVPVTGGDVAQVFTPGSNFMLVDVNRRTAEYLALKMTASKAPDRELWIVPMRSGVPRQVGGILCRQAAFSSDGRRIAFVNGSALYVAQSDGSASRQLSSPAGQPGFLRWSPSGAVLRFNVVTVEDRADPESALWEVRIDGSDLHPLLPGWNRPAAECCGAWSPDGAYFVFASVRQGRSDLWLIQEAGRILPGGKAEPIRLTDDSLDFYDAVFSADGQTVFAMGAPAGVELSRHDSTTGVFVPHLAGVPGTWVTESPGRRFIAFIRESDHQLWVANADGSNQKVLTTGPFDLDGATWSPDGEWIAFRSRMGGKHLRIYLVSPQDGNPHPISEADLEQGIPTWSADGTRLVFSDVPAVFGKPDGNEVLHIYDVARKTFSVVPGPPGQLWTSRWSPNGKELLALTIVGQQMRIFDFTSQRWRALPDDPQGVDTPIWSRDAAFIYYKTLNGSHIRRARVADGHIETVAELNHWQFSVAAWLGLAADDSPILLRRPGSPEVYALRLSRR